MYGNVEVQVEIERVASVMYFVLVVHDTLKVVITTGTVLVSCRVSEVLAHVTEYAVDEF